MPVIAQQSKFACLKIYDDSGSSSEDEGKRLVAISKKGKSGDQRRGEGKKAGGTGGPLLVHVVPPKPKNRKKPKKAPQVVDEDGFIVQDADEDYIERKYREDLRAALKNSAAEAASSAAAVQNNSAATVQNNTPTQSVKSTGKTQTSKNKKPAENDVRKIDEEPIDPELRELDRKAEELMKSSTCSNRDKMIEAQLVALYRKCLINVMSKLAEQTATVIMAKGEADKYKNRYKKICELLKDAELNEKAHMTAELERARRVEGELGAQIEQLQGELMQARTKIRELENRLEKH